MLILAIASCQQPFSFSLSFLHLSLPHMPFLPFCLFFLCASLSAPPSASPFLLPKSRKTLWGQTQNNHCCF